MLDNKIDLSRPGTAVMFDEVSLWASRFGALLIDQLELYSDLPTGGQLGGLDVPILRSHGPPKWTMDPS